MPHIFRAWTFVHVYFRNFDACTWDTPTDHLQPSIVLRRGQPERRCTVYHSIGADTKEDDCEVCAVYSKVWENWDWETKLRLMKYYVRAHPDIPKTPIHNKHTHKKRKCAKCGASCTACIMMLTAENRSRLNFLEF